MHSPVPGLSPHAGALRLRPLPKMRSRPVPAVSSRLGRKRLSRGPYTWCGATATVSSSGAWHASMQKISPIAFVAAYS